MNIKNWHVPFRTQLELRSFKTRICQRWFSDLQIGTFREIVQEVAREAGIGEDAAAKDIERTLKRNATQSILKSRHLVIAKELLANGLGAGAIAEVLTRIEGFPISIDVVQCNPDIEAWRRANTRENPQALAHRGKIAEVVGSEIRLHITNETGERTQFARLPVQEGATERVGDSNHRRELNADQRERLAGTLYAAYLGPQQIAEVLTALTGTQYQPYTITNILRKLKQGDNATLEVRDAGILQRTECRELRARVAGDKVVVYVGTGAEGGDTNVATVDIPSARITWHRDPQENRPADYTVVDRAVANLYGCGVAPRRIPDVIAGAYAVSLTYRQVMDTIQRGQDRGILRRHKAGYFHRTDTRNIKARIEDDHILVWEDTHEQAKIAISDGKCAWYQNDEKSSGLAPELIDALITRLYNKGVNTSKIANAVQELSGSEFNAIQLHHRLNVLEKQGEIQRLGVGECNAAERKCLRVRIQNVYITVEQDGEQPIEEVIAEVDLRAPLLHEQVNLTLEDATTIALYKSGLKRDEIRDVLAKAGIIVYSRSSLARKLEELEKRGTLERRARGADVTKDSQEISYKIENNRVVVTRKSKRLISEVMDQFDLTGIILPKTKESQVRGSDPHLSQVASTPSAATQDQSKEGRAGDKCFETYVRFRWHVDPRVGIAEELGKDLGISPEEVRRLVTRQNAWGVLKPAHVYFLRELAYTGATPTEMARVVENLEGISLSQTPVRTKLARLEKEGFLTGKATNPHLKTETTHNEIIVQDGDAGNIIKTITVANAVAAAEAGFNGLYAYPPPTAAQYEVASARARETCESFEQIRQQGGWQGDTLEALLLHGVYAGNRAAYKDRFLTTFDQATIDKLVTYALNSDLSLTEIAARCGCSSSAAKKYITLEAYIGNEEAYNERFNPPSLTPEQDRAANAIAQGEQGKPPTDRRSFASITREVGAPYNATRAAVVRGTYGNNETAFASDYPGGRQSLPAQLVWKIIHEITTTEGSVYAIAQRLGTSEAAVSRVALIHVYNHDYERYSKRFPEKRVDKAAVAVATEHIRDPTSPCRTYRAIAHKVTAEVAPISPATVMVLAKHLLTRAERVERFRGDPDYRIGQVTHVVAEGVCKMAAQRVNIAAYSEVRKPRPWTANHKDEVPTSQQRRWVKADLALRLAPGQAGQLFDRLGVNGAPLGEEAGWSPETIANAREILFDFSADTTQASVRGKNAKYATDKRGRAVKKRLVLHVATADWFGEGRVQPAPDGWPNARVVSLDYVADLLQMTQHAREVLADLARNSRARDQAAQERLAARERYTYCDDTARYYADRGMSVPDWRGPQQTLDKALKDAPKPRPAPAEPPEPVEQSKLGEWAESAAAPAESPGDRTTAIKAASAATPTPRQIDPERLAEAREFAKVLQQARDADKNKGEKGLDPTRLAEAREFAKVLQEARDADKRKVEDGLDPARLTEAREYVKTLQKARNADKIEEDKKSDFNAGAKDPQKGTQEVPRKASPERLPGPHHDINAF